MDRADDLAGAIDKGVHHRGTGVRADVSETIPAFLETTDTEFFAADGYFADIARGQRDVADLFGYFMPFESFEAHAKNCLWGAGGATEGTAGGAAGGSKIIFGFIRVTYLVQLAHLIEDGSPQPFDVPALGRGNEHAVTIGLALPTLAQLA